MIRMDEIKICIIDEYIEMDKLKKLVPDVPTIKTIQKEAVLINQEISHGTICLAILLESLKKCAVIDKVSVEHFSVSENGNPRTYAALLNALRYCINKRFNIISMSIGVFGRICAQDIHPIVNKLQDTLIVAAASNIGRITYPASMPTVLGVKSATDPLAPRFSVVDAPPDGIELVANIPDTSVMKAIHERYDVTCSGSNSILVPQVSAEIISQSIKYAQKPTKRIATNWLSMNTKVGKEYYNPQLGGIGEEYIVPAIAFPYHVDETSKVIYKAFQLKRIFENQDYLCAIISDIFTSNDFIQGYYQLDIKSPFDCISYYQYAVSDSLIVVFAQTALLQRCSCDLVISNWREMTSFELCQTILQRFS